MHLYRTSLGTTVDSVWMYCVHWNKPALLICPFIFRSFQFSNIKIFITYNKISTLVGYREMVAALLFDLIVEEMFYTEILNTHMPTV